MMAEPVMRDAGSFRDPSGYVFVDGQQVWRTVNASAVEEFNAAANSGLLTTAQLRGLLIDHAVDDSPALKSQLRGPRGEEPQLVLRHPRVPLVSYPYEWTFSQLRDAALQHLDLQLLALEFGFNLSDATAYNMQFHDGGLLHIDMLSLRRYRDGEPWIGYNQFCRQFLFPLLLEAKVGVAFQKLYRGSIAGLDVHEINRLIPLRKKLLSLNTLMHVVLQSKATSTSSSNFAPNQVRKDIRLPKPRFQLMLKEMRAWIGGLKSSRSQATYWSSYATINTYTGDMRQQKEAFIERNIRAWGCATSADLGGNSGDYSLIALRAGVTNSYILDSDLDALEVAYAKRKSTVPGLLPLVMDCVDPVPSMGWNQAERKGLAERLQVDCVMALALIHHLVIANNIPLQSFVDWVLNKGRYALVEFVPKTDPMVVGLLRHRDDIFEDYTEKRFLTAIASRARIVDTLQYAPGGRMLVACERLHP